jgi:hypothetical protein
MAINSLTFTQPQAYSGGADFSQLANLGNVYREAQNRDKLSALGKDLAAGKVTYQEAAGRVGELGDIGNSLKFLQLAEARRLEELGLKASGDFGRQLIGAGGGPQVAAAAPRGAAVPAAETEVGTAPARAPVASSPTTWGDDEAEKAGLYAPKPAPAQAAPVPPQPVAPAAPVSAAPPPPVPPDQAAIDPRVRSAQASAPPTLLTEGPKMEHVPMLITALRNPYLPATDKEIAKDMLKRAFDSAKPTEKIQTLMALRDDPSLLAIEKELRKSSSPNINLPAGEKAQDTEMGKTLAEIHGGYVKEALKVPANKANLDAAERAMSSKDFSSGIFQPVTMAAQRALVGMGIADADKAGPNELFQKLQNKAIMDSGGSASGLGPQISNNDAKIIRDSTFNATNTPAGNKMIIGFQKLLEDRKVAYTREMNRYAKEHGGRIDINVMEHMADWAEKPANALDFSKVPGFDPKAAAAPPPAASQSGWGAQRLP